MTKKSVPWVLGSIIITMVAAVYWIYPPVLHRVELLFQTGHFLWRGPMEAGDEVVIAAVDEKSLDEIGRWPWPRSVMAKLVDKLVDQEARVIGFDMVFSSPDEGWSIQKLRELRRRLQLNGTQETGIRDTLNWVLSESDDDGELASALVRSKRAVLGYFFHFDPEEVAHLTDEVKQANLQNIKSSQFSGFLKSKAEVDLFSINFPEAFAVESNISLFSQNVRQAGYFNFFLEPDGSLRKLPLIVRYEDPTSLQDYYFPPLSIRILEKYLEGNLLFRVNEFGVEKVILDGARSIEIPTSRNGEFYVNYLGGHGILPQVSITDILNDRNENLPPGGLRDKIVIIGSTAPALADMKVTPFDAAFPGVEIHATIINNILKENFIYNPDWIPAADTMYLVVLGFLLVLLYSRVKALAAALVWIGVSVGLLFLNHWIFLNLKIWIANVYPLLENLVLFVSLTVYRYLTEEKQKKFIQGAFGQYISPNVVEQLIRDPDRLKLGGEKRVLTAFFSDLEEFTAVSEMLPPEKLVDLLNNYLSEMTDILLKYEGTLDKYDGDAIKAFFGAPITFKDHAKRACLVAIEMQERLHELRKMWKEQGRPQLYMRIGLNTGPMVVGNMGSRNRMNYGINGDAVNLAARLEGVNKFYGTGTIISENTWKQARKFVEVRELDRIVVVGKTHPVKIFELLGRAGAVNGKLMRILPLYYEGLSKYKARSWDEAIQHFHKVLSVRPGDGPSKTYLHRCRRFKKHPPPEYWDGVFNLSAK